MPGAGEQQASWDKWMAFGLIKRLFARDEGRDALSPLYHAVIAEARQPAWYLDGKVADTMDGRFEMVAAVTALAILRLDGEGEPGRLPAVMLTEIFVDDMDGQLRQEGIGDIVVGKHIGKMMAALGGRMEAYKNGLDGGDLEAALVRNLYRTENPGPDALAFTAHQLRDLWARLCASPLDALLAGTIAKAQA
jgi:cytochrome b pre-mRNA-processing protein 3